MTVHRHFYQIRTFYQTFTTRIWVFKCKTCGDLQYRTYGALWGGGS